jgi:hypothetical protein
MFVVRVSHCFCNPESSGTNMEQTRFTWISAIQLSHTQPIQCHKLQTVNVGNTVTSHITK